MTQLHEERARIEAAIDKLEMFLGGLVEDTTAALLTTRARAEVTALPPTVRQRSRAGWTAEARLAAAERMRRYWADRRSRPEEARPRGRRRPATEAQPEAALTTGLAAGEAQPSDPHPHVFWRDETARRAVSG